jgi:tetratricopeptide (TPR) repeat protein
MTAEEIKRHDELFREAVGLAEQRIQVHSRRIRSPDSSDRQTLENALHLFEQVIQLNERNWAAMWFIGKIHQRLGDHNAAYDSFKASYSINPSQMDVAREAAIAAAEIGEIDAAIVFAHRAVQLAPQDAGLHANLALANLLSGRLSAAAAEISRALAIHRSDVASRTVAQMIAHFQAKGTTPPRSTPELITYWNRLKKG